MGRGGIERVHDASWGRIVSPSGVRPRSRWSRLWPWAFAVIGALHASRFNLGLPPAFGIPAAALGVLAFLGLVLALATRSYRASDALGRRQIRWFLLGLYLAQLRGTKFADEVAETLRQLHSMPQKIQRVLDGLGQTDNGGGQ